VLLAWELGEGLGHLPPLKAIALALQPLGVKPVFALREIHHAGPALRDFNAPVFVAPHWSKPAAPPFKTGSFADILGANGYTTSERAASLIGAWDRLIDEVKPDAIVCEHAPSAMLSAFGRIPVAFVGNGFAVPPADEAQFPPYTPGVGSPEGQDVVLEAISVALRRLGRPAPATLTAPFRGDFRGVYSFPLIDSYRSVRRERVLGPIEPQPPLAPLPDRPRLFVYSAVDFARIDALFQCLMDIGPEASVYLRGNLGPRAAILRSRGVEVFDAPQPFAEIMPRASVVFSHAGSGFTNAALASGRPHITFPRHFEAKASAMGLEQAGCGIRLSTLDVESFRAAYRRAHMDTAMREAAQRVGRDAQDFIVSARAHDVTIEAVKRLLGG
jgi:rhamnosyltransferase subunit B